MSERNGDTLTSPVARPVNFFGLPFSFCLSCSLLPRVTPFLCILLYSCYDFVKLQPADLVLYSKFSYEQIYNVHCACSFHMQFLAHTIPNLHSLTPADLAKILQYSILSNFNGIYPPGGGCTIRCSTADQLVVVTPKHAEGEVSAQVLVDGHAVRLVHYTWTKSTFF